MELAQFMNVISQLVFKSCDVIKSVHESESLGIMMKGELNPVTMADMTIQSMIVKTLTKLWPTIQIVGEETIDSDSAFSSTLDEAIEDNVEFFKQYFKNTVLNLEDFCIWIDPLDGTLSFTRGNLEDVTVMVGISYKQKARIGVIGIPYEKDQTTNECHFNPRVVLSDCDSQSVIQFNRDFSELLLMSSPKTKTNKLIISRNLPHHQAKLIRNITDETVETCAMGNKFIHMVKQKAAGLIYLGKVASLWDTCAGEALIRSLGGVVTNLLGNDIIYDNSRSTYELGNGIVCAFSQTKMQQISSKICITCEN